MLWTQLKQIIICTAMQACSGRVSQLITLFSLTRTVSSALFVSYFLIQLLSNNVAERFTMYNIYRPDGIQSLSYALCHVYARCTRSVSLPAPIFCKFRSPTLLSRSSPIYSCSNKSRCTQRVHPRKKPLRAATGPSTILSRHGGNGGQCRSGSGAKR